MPTKKAATIESVEVKDNAQSAAVSGDSPGVFSESGVGLALVALIALNLLNYLDRNLLAGAQPVLQQSLKVSDSRLGALSSLFFVAYMLAAPLLGWLGDRFPQRVLVPASVLWWSAALGIATVGRSFSWFPFAYAMVGVGEAAFGVYAVAMLSDYYPHANRSRALSLYLLAMCVGRAVGLPLGGWLALIFGWQSPFRVMSLAGVLLALVCAKVFFSPATRRNTQIERSSVRIAPMQLARILAGKGYLFPVLGLAMENFISGGISVWMPTYLHRVAGYSIGRATGGLGMAMLVGGIGATWLGGVLGERWLRRDRRGLYWISAASLFMVAPCIAATLSGSPRLVLVGIIGSQIFLFLNMGPINTAILNAVPASVRSTAVAVEIFLIHALGDAVSPRLIGLTSDAHGLRAALSMTIIAALAGVVLLMYGARGAPSEDQ